MRSYFGLRVFESVKECCAGWRRRCEPQTICCMENSGVTAETSAERTPDVCDLAGVWDLFTVGSKVTQRAKITFAMNAFSNKKYITVSHFKIIYSFG